VRRALRHRKSRFNASATIHFVLVLKSFRSRTVDAGQEELVPKAREVCGEKNAGYGRYEFETAEPVGRRRRRGILSS